MNLSLPRAAALLSAASVLFVISSCRSPLPAGGGIKAGMSEAELLRAFGEPVRKIEHRDGGAEWVYRLRTADWRSASFSERTVEWDEISFSAGMEASVTVGETEGVVRLSPARRVTGAVPAGEVIRRPDASSPSPGGGG